MPTKDTHEVNGHTLHCKCGHTRSQHHNSKDCLAVKNHQTGEYCYCHQFVERKEKDAKSR